MVSEISANGQEDLETVLLDFLGAIRTADREAMRAVLDPDVTWQGLQEDWVCNGPDEVIETLQRERHRRRDVIALEFIRADDRVVMGVRGPALDEVGGEPLNGQIFNVFTLINGRIVRIEDHRLRSEALRSAGLGDDPGWR